MCIAILSQGASLSVAEPYGYTRNNHLMKKNQNTAE